MAKVLFGNGVAAIRGSIAGNVYSVGPNGAYIRNKGQAANPQTPLQQAIRSRFADIVLAFKALNSSQAEQWVSYAAGPEGLYTDSLGQQQHYTAQQLFIARNMALAAYPTLTAVTSPAGEASDPPLISFDNLLAEEADGTLEDFTWTLNSNHADGNYYTIRFARASSGSKTRPKSHLFRSPDPPHKEAEDDDEPGDGFALYQGLFGTDVVAGQHIWIELTAIDPKTGKQAAPVYQSVEITTQAP